MMDGPAPETTSDRRELALAAKRRTLDELAPLVGYLAEGKYWDADGPGVRIRDFDVQQALTCPTHAAGPEEPFEPTPAKARRPVVVEAARRLLADEGLDLVAAVRVALTDRDALDWAADWLLDESGPAERAVTAAVSLRDLAEWRRCLPWPLRPADLDQRRRWSYPDRALLLETRFDAQERDEDGVSFHAISRADRPSEETDRLAYQALASSLAARMAPERIIVHYPRTGGTPRSVPVTEDLLARGVAVAHFAIEVALVTLGLRHVDLARRPSWRCYECVFVQECEPGRTWLDGPGRLRGGLMPSTV